VLVVLQQHHRLDRGLVSQCAMRGRQGDPLHPLRVAIAEWVLEQAQPILGLQHAAHGSIDFTHRHFAAANQRRQLVQVGAAVQVDVDAGGQRQSRGVGGRGGDAVLLQFRYGVEVGDDHAIKAPAFAQQAGQQRAVGRAGDVVECCQRRHHGTDAAVDQCTERRQVDDVQQALRQVGRVVVAPAFHRAVADEVLGRGQHGVSGGEVVALEAAQLRARHRGAEIGVFARTFHHAAPAWIAADVDHRAEGPVHAGGGGFNGSGAVHALDQCGIPGCRQRQRYRESRAESMVHIAHEPQRDLQPRLHRQLLQTAGVGQHILPRQHAVGATQMAFADELIQVLAIGAGDAHLTDLFFQCHPRQQVVDEGVHTRRRDRCRGFCACHDHARECCCK
jgi:hypothetical protein